MKGDIEIFQIHINNIEFQLITDGSVWVLTKNGLYIINKRDKSTPKVRTFISKEELKKQEVKKQKFEDTRRQLLH